jgi:SMODS and SLOG-associating 2TM effector domain family 5
MNKILSLRDAAENFRTKMWRTAGARFICQRRMKSHDTTSSFTIAILSVYLIAISVAQKIYNVGQSNPQLDNHLTFISIIGAVFIIVISLVEWASNFPVRAERLFENATEIKMLFARLDRALIEGVPENALGTEFAAVCDGYEKLVDKNSPNHDPIDDFLFRAQNRSEPHASFKMNWYQALYANVKWFSITYGFYALLLLVIPAVVYKITN